ncbi:MAG: RNA methyltransferase [SAR202 cluster bacterium]|nr:RNA methyltransferase [SAR202 cluster bacterium]|tara:strand:- start:670 stop:1164 length:495 start_codon:yes stop_codon:yes gene_type:complete
MKKKLNRYISRKSTLNRRGFACIGLTNPQDGVNIGHALRAALCFDVRMIILENPSKNINIKKLLTDPGKTYRHIPVITTSNILDIVPTDCEIIGVELDPKSIDLRKFHHPERGCYIFGPENGSINENLLKKCSSIVSIPTTVSLNLGMTVNIAMYDRLLKTHQS